MPVAYRMPGGMSYATPCYRNSIDSGHLRIFTIVLPLLATASTFIVLMFCSFLIILILLVLIIVFIRIYSFYSSHNFAILLNYLNFD